MSQENTDSNPESLKNGSQASEAQTTDQPEFGTSMADVLAGIDSAIETELGGKVPDVINPAKEEDERKAKEEADKKAAEAGTKEPDKEKSKEKPKEEVVVDPSKVEEKPKETEEDDDPVLSSEAPGGAHASPETKTHWKKLQDVAKQAKEEARATKAQLAELQQKAQASEGQLPEEVNKELTYLRQRIAEVDLASSPEFKKKYETQLSSIEESVLEDFGAMEATGNAAAKDIKAKLKTALENAGGMTNYNWSSLLDLCEKHKLVDGIGRKRIETKVANALNIEETRQKELEAASQNFEATRQKTAQERQKIVQDLDSFIKDFTSKNDWTQPPKDPGANATAEEKAEYQEALKLYNTGSQQFVKMVNSTLKTYGVVGGDGSAMPTPKEAVEMIFDAVRAKIQDKTLVKKEKEIGNLKERVEELETELGKYRKAGNTAHKKTSPSQGSNTKSEPSLPGTTQEALAGIGEDLNNFLGEQK